MVGRTTHLETRVRSYEGSEDSDSSTEDDSSLKINERSCSCI